MCKRRYSGTDSSKEISSMTLTAPWRAKGRNPGWSAPTLIWRPPNVKNNQTPLFGAGMSLFATTQSSCANLTFTISSPQSFRTRRWKLQIALWIWMMLTTIPNKSIGKVCSSWVSLSPSLCKQGRNTWWSNLGDKIPVSTPYGLVINGRLMILSPSFNSTGSSRLNSLRVLCTSTLLGPNERIWSTYRT